MNQKRSLFLFLFLLVSFACQSMANDIYRKEFKALKAMKDYETIFNKDAHQGIRWIHRDVKNYKQLTHFQRFVRSAFLALDVVIVTPETMPTLYAYIEGICKQQAIATPTIFLTVKKGFFNAAAQKLLMSSGGIIIGQDLLLKITDKELEAVVAHEIGHIKHNHINKMLGVLAGSTAACYAALGYLIKDKDAVLVKLFLSLEAASLITSLVINKRFERQADEFAYKENDKGEDLIKFLEHLKQMHQDRDDDLTNTRALLTTNKAHMDSYDYYLDLLPRYYLIKLGHIISKGCRWLYHHTPLGPHPSPESRIASVKKYLEQQKNCAAEGR